MNQRQVLELTSKILSLYFLVSAVGALRDVVLFSGIRGISDYEQPFSFWVGPGVSLIINVFFFWFFAFKSRLIARLVQRTSEDEYNLSLGIDKSGLLEIAIVTIGMIAIVFSLPAILQLLADSIYIKREPNAFSQYQKPFSEFLYAIFKVIVGLVVVLYARQLSKFIIKRGERDDLYDRVRE